MKPIFAGVRRRLAAAGAFSALVGIAVCAVGCDGERDSYTIVLTPRGDSLERSIRIERRQSREDSLRGVLHPHLEPGMAPRLSAAYHVAVDTAQTAPYMACRTFPDVPDDIGTRGHYRHMASPLGDAYFYAERIRGMDDPAGWIAHRFASGDSLAQGVADWLRFELVTQPEWPRVSATLEPELRTIARTLVAVTLTAGDKDSLQEGWLLTFAPEHPLFALLGVPGLKDAAEASRYAPYFARARADLARRLGLRSAADEARVLGFLADGTAILASYRRWIRGAPEEEAYVRDDIEAWLLDLTEEAMVADGVAVVTVELRLPNRPFDTNGPWNDSAGCVRWRASCPGLDRRSSAVPLACSAVWSVPDSVTQRRLFGDIVLRDGDLFNFADWYASLSPARQAQWSRMMLALRPGQSAPLEKFRFADERDGGDASAHFRTLLRDALSARAARGGVHPRSAVLRSTP